MIVTLDEVKAHLRIDQNAEDAYLDAEEAADGSAPEGEA